MTKRSTFRAPIRDIKLLKPVPCGMDPYTLLALVPPMRTTTEDHEPVLLRDSWRLLDGRHRFFTAVMGGASWQWWRSARSTTVDSWSRAVSP